MLRLLSLSAVALSASLAVQSAPAEPQAALALATKVAERAANEGRVGTMHFHMENKSGRTRERTALMVHSDRDAVERIAIFFTAPAMIEETAFLSFNHEVAEDENWLFLPATERVRRLPASDRGDYFMGTDLTYGDVKDNFKFDLADWVFAIDREQSHNGRTLPVLTGTARTPDLKKEMGYASFRALIDTETAFPLWVEYTDQDGDPLKRVDVLQVDEVGEAQTAMRFTAENLQTGHKTEVYFSDMRYVPDLDETLFEPDTLAYGVPAIGEG